MNRPFHFLAAVVASLALHTTLHAMWIQPVDMPVDRLVANITQHLKEKPTDADAWYRLGRIHSYAYSMGAASLPVYGVKPGLEQLHDSPGTFAPPLQKPSLSAEARIDHLREANRCLSKAIELSGGKPLYYLSLASLLEAGKEDSARASVIPGMSDPSKGLDPAVWLSVGKRTRIGTGADGKSETVTFVSDEALDDLAIRLGLKAGNGFSDVLGRERDRTIVNVFAAMASDDPKISSKCKQLVSQDWNEQISENYFRAFCAALPTESKLSFRYDSPVWSRHVFVEAGNRYLATVDANAQHNAVRIAIVKTSLAKYESVPVRQSPITPVVFSLTERPLSELVSPNSDVAFDLDGSGRVQTWGWINPETALLVYTECLDTPITSGRQLFGSVSWWIPFDNGYEALACLDDNRDSLLCGEELRGIGAWFDRNSNGVSDAGEVVPLDSLGVATLSTVQTGVADDGVSPMSANGLRLRDGRTLPTYDWVATTKPAPR